MPTKWNFLSCFILLILLKNNSPQVKITTQNTLVEWDTQNGEELVLTRKIVILEQSAVCNLSFKKAVKLL